ncbi:MAG: hypothetical protein A2020_14945 [Lentisphaerae bacterium GWF2_45_14]|nr:MAG: hypothetical protein A2020_14945 [Lentisphaerae bacterium GWF2_45_14]
MLFSNPIFRREFISSARSLKLNLLVGGYLLALGGLLLILWPGGGIQSAVSESSKQIFSLFYSVNLTLMILLVPAFAATSITYEKENNTYPALFTTILSPFDIMAGKLAASILMLVLVALLSMPVASICALTGGISLMFVFKLMFLLMLTAVTYGLIGLACSSTCERGTSAILINYVLIIVFAGATWLPEALLSSFGFVEIWQVMRSVSPYDALYYMLFPDNYRMTMQFELLPGAGFNPFSIFVTSNIAILLGALGVFYFNILRAKKTGAVPKGQIYTGFKKGLKRKLTWPFYLLDPLKRKNPIRKYSNPVFVAEMRSKLFANPKFVIRSVSAIFIISMLLLTLIAFQFGVGLRADTIRTVSIIFQIGIVAMLAPGVSSGLITDELVNDTLTPLRMTTIKPFTVVLGKLKATFFYAMIFIFSGLFVLFAMAYLEQQEIFPDGTVLDDTFWLALFKKMGHLDWWQKFWETYYNVFLWIGMLLLSTITFLSAGLFSSAVSKTTAAATALGYSITAGICIVSFAPMVLGARLSYGLSFFILSFNPIAGAMQITNEAFQEFPNLWKYNIFLMALLTTLFIAAATFRMWYLFRRQD